MRTTSSTIVIGGNPPVSRLGFGAMRVTGRGIWGPPGDPDGALEVLRRVPELGIGLIDTADSYGPEISEDLIAKALHPYPENLLIATKGGLRRPGPGQWTPDGRPEHLRAACEGSLRRLGVERVDLYQLHRPDPDVPYEESVGALVDLQREGKIRHIGVSNVSLEQLRQARTTASVVSVQNRHNLTDRSSDEIVAACEADGIAFLAWAPLDSGGVASASGALARIAASHGATPAQVALAWLLRLSPAIVPIPGTSSVEHLEANVAATSIELTGAEMTELAQARPTRLDTARRRLRARAAGAARRLGLRS